MNEIDAVRDRARKLAEQGKPLDNSFAKLSDQARKAAEAAHRAREEELRRRGK